jgi:toxin ParE1/3/4
MSIRYRVLLTSGAEQDIEAIHAYIAESDSPEKANYVLEQLVATTNKLETMPDRGSYPKELVSLGIKEFRQIFFKPYRVIYRIVGKDVFVLVIADGRRDLQSTLTSRLLS